MKAAIKKPQPGSVLKVGDGRGFIIEYRVKVSHPWLPRRSKLQLPDFTERRVIVTAAHCLPNLPPSHPAAFRHERTYADLVGPLDGSKRRVWAECLFVNPVADIAVLGCPDEQELDAQADAYYAVTENAPAFRIGRARSGPGWVLSLDGRWVRTVLDVFSNLYGDASLSIDPTKAGMSGSPILDAAGRAVGVVAVGSETINSRGERKEKRAWGQPILTHDLPGWLLSANPRFNGEAFDEEQRRDCGHIEVVHQNSLVQTKAFEGGFIENQRCSEAHECCFLAAALLLRPVLIRASRVLPSTPPLFQSVERHFFEGQFWGFPVSVDPPMPADVATRQQPQKVIPGRPSKSKILG